MKKVLFVAKVVRSHIMTFHLPYLKMFKDMGWETTVAAHNDYENPNDCVIPYCDKYLDVPFERFPLSPSNITSYKKMKKIINDGNYDIIHCHTPVSAMITRLAAIGARKRGTKVIYTAHGFHFFKGAPVINWLLYFPVEWLLAHWTDALITINQEDYNRAKKFAAKKLFHVPGVGIDTNRFKPDPEIRAQMRNDFGISENEYVLLSVGELNENKNHQIVIRALPKYKDWKYVICGKGPIENDLKHMAKKFGVENRVIFAGYRTDINNFYRMADCFVFPSHREGLPVAPMEAMAAEIPCVASKIRGNVDLFEDSELLFDPDRLFSLFNALEKAVNENIAHREIERNKKNLHRFSMDEVVKTMKEIYSEYI